VWGRIFANSELRYDEPRLVLYAEGTVSGCGAAQAAMGPFYCPADRTIYLDTDFFATMETRLGARGEFARAYVIAHEVGHHVQNALGVLPQVNARRAQLPRSEANALSVRVELQADCYAGIWARAAAARLALTERDIRDALEAAARIGDDALQRAAGGRVVPDNFTHGTSAQRQRWFDAGFRSGNPGDCDSLSAQTL
jgi:predicted metalloprotease